VNKYECTIDQELTCAAAQAPGRRFVFTHQVAAFFLVWGQIENSHSSDDACLLQEHSC